MEPKIIYEHPYVAMRSTAVSILFGSKKDFRKNSKCLKKTIEQEGTPEDFKSLSEELIKTGEYLYE